MTKKSDEKQSDDTVEMLAVNLGFKAETPPEVVTQSFAKKVEELMNHAYQQSQPAQGQEVTEHHQRFAHWCNLLGDVHREVKQHVK